jgi:iron complex transport system ATP-binding protein
VSIAVDRVCVRFGAITVVDDVSFSVPAGSWTTLIGPNGAGKTTIVSSVVGLQRVTSGAVRIEDTDVHELSERTRAGLVAYVPQRPIIPVGSTVVDYISLGRTAYHGVLRAPSPADRQIVDGVIERMGLAKFRHRDVSSLSGGERQRVVLARTLAQGTRVVVLDEPTAGLDVRHQLELLDLLRKEVEECQLTVLATLHDLTTASHYADQLVLLDAGRVATEGSPGDVVRSPALSRSYGMALRVVTVEGQDIVVPVRAEQ